MFIRTVSSVMIAAIIACPLLCGNGLGFADLCCTAEKGLDEPCAVQKTSSCCCDKPSSENNDDQPEDAPYKSKCQGVCSGAVFEKPVDLNDVLDSSFLPLIAAETSVACQLVECRTHDGKHFLFSGGNHGRTLRTLHQSFLC